MRKNFYQQGQIGLIILLVAIIMMTLGIALASRSIQQVANSRQENQSTENFSFTDKSIEEQLETGGFTGLEDIEITETAFTAGSEFTTNVIDFGESVEFKVNTGTIDIKLLNAGSNSPSDCVPNGLLPAMIIAFYGDDFSERHAYDPCANRTTLPNGNGFIAYNIADFVSLSVPSQANIVRIKVLYADSPIVVSGNGLSASQFKQITATGKNDDTTRSVSISTGEPALPAIFDYVLFSEGNIE